MIGEDCAGLRILVVANLYPSEQTPAFGAFVQRRIEALRRAGHRVDVVAIRDARVHTRVARKYASLALRAAYHALAERIRRHRYAVVEAHIAIPTGVVAMPAAALAGCPLVVFAHGSDVVRIGPRSALTRALSRVTFRRATLVIANSQFTRDRVNQLGPTRRPVAVISPGILTARNVMRAVERTGILFVGRLTPEKGVAALIEAVGLLEPPFPTLTIVGDGPQREHLEQAARDGAVTTTFVGAVNPTQIADWYQRAQVVVVPSLVAEGLGLVALEGMANGAIVVATRVGALGEIVEDGVNGFLVEPGNATALRDGIRAALRSIDMGKAPAMVVAAQVTASAHDVDVCVAETIDAYKAIIRNAR